MWGNTASLIPQCLGADSLLSPCFLVFVLSIPTAKSSLPIISQDSMHIPSPLQSLLISQIGVNYPPFLVLYFYWTKISAFCFVSVSCWYVFLSPNCETVGGEEVVTESIDSGQYLTRTPTAKAQEKQTFCFHARFNSKLLKITPSNEPPFLQFHTYTDILTSKNSNILSSDYQFLFSKFSPFPNLTKPPMS